MVRFSFLIGFISFTLYAQPPIADFQVADKACRNENIILTNESSGAVSYQWEFCRGGIGNTPVSINSTFLSPGNALEGTTLIYDGTQWYGFIANTNANGILRLNFGSDLISAPTVSDLANPGNLLDRPRDISIIHSGTDWYALVTNFNPVSGISKIVRLSFGASLTNAPVAQDLGDFGGRLMQAYAIEWTADQSEWIAIVSDRSQRKLLLINFHNSPLNNPSVSTDFIEVFLPNGGFLKDFSILRDLSGWHAVAIVENGNVFKLGFTNQLFEIPIIHNITSSVPLTGFPNNVVLVRDVDCFYALILQFEGDLLRLDFGKSMQNLTPAFQNMGKLGTLANMQGLAFCKVNNQWVGYSTSVSNQLKRILFNSECSAAPSSSTFQTPALMFSGSSMKPISLEVVNSFGEKRYVLDSILIKTNPTAHFTFALNCAGQSTLFADASTDDDVITNWQWDFGDPASGASNTSTVANPAHTYSTPGSYPVTLTVTDDCGDANTIIQPVQENDLDAITLGITPAGPVCSFQDISFSPQTSTGIASVSQAEWSFGDGNESTQIQPTYQYETFGLVNVQLNAVVSQCFKSASIPLVVNEGPQVQFNFTGNCQQEVIQFSNQTVGSVTGYTWDFNDGPNSTEADPIHIFSNTGVYDVTLTASNLAGCNNTKTKSVPIYSKPQVNFFLSPPPLSCNGTPSQFNDLTPNPTDSNIASWSWNFGDAGSSQNTSALRNPQHTYANAGSYDVSLVVSTNFSCSETIQLPVTISQSPIADFNHEAPCEDELVSFSDVSTGTIDSWDWMIGGTVYATQNPAHTFVNSGNTSATLIVNASNDCISSINKSIVVPAKLSPDFSVDRNCTEQQTLFTDITNATADPVSSSTWDFGGLGIASGASANFTFTNTGNVNVEMTITTQTGCVYPVSKIVNITSSPQANFTASPEAGAPPLAVQFTNTSAGSTSYLWSFNDSENTTNTQTSPMFTFQELGEYEVNLVAYNTIGCSDTSYHPILVAPITGLEYDRNFNFNAPYPNPAQKNLFLGWNTQQPDKLSVNVLDVFGRVILESGYLSTTGKNEAVIRLDGLKAGVYFLQMHLGQKRTTFQIMVSSE